jgi:hypothetical protein
MKLRRQVSKRPCNVFLGTIILIGLLCSSIFSQPATARDSKKSRTQAKGLPDPTQPVRTQNLIKLKKIKTFDDYIKGYFSPDGTKLALSDYKKIKIVNLPKGKEICKPDITV